jgi:tripartite-type tricarboxylate transporter receptor subunit TctC
MPFIQAGKVKALGVSSTTRVPAMPDIPTIAEAGVPTFEAVSWQMFAVPAGTPRPIVEKLNADLVKALADPDLKTRYAQLGVEPVSSTPEFLGEFIRTEQARYAKVIKDAGITAN